MAALQQIKGDTINATGALLNLMRFDKPIEKTNLALNLPLRAYSEINPLLKKLRAERKAQFKDHIQTVNFSRYQHLEMTDSEIINLAKIKSETFSRRYFNADNSSDFDWSYEHTIQSFNLLTFGINVHPVPKNATQKQYRSACLRLSNPLWWRRQLRSTRLRTLEHERIKLGIVGRVNSQLYVSDKTLADRQHQKRRNARILESLNAINEQGYEKDLLSLQKVTVSNPEIRRNELMARLKGLETYALNQKLAAEFWTFTTPSKYHRISTAYNNGANLSYLNPAYGLFSPRDAQQYLNNQWQKIRATFSNQGIDCSGVRVAEPHHDGTPHWHLLLFFKKNQRTQARQIARCFMLQVDPDEKGAQQHRFKAKRLTHSVKNGKRQSPVGYVAKYIAKNLTPIDSTTNLNNDGAPVHTTVDRVEAWASVWGIRQFQQIGGERITIWRELRKIRDFNSEDKHFYEVHHAADNGDYNEFIKASKHIEKVLILKKLCTVNTPEKVQSINRQTGEVYDYDDREHLNQYGEPKNHQIIGLSSANHYLFTRLLTWQIKSRREKPHDARQRI